MIMKQSRKSFINLNKLVHLIGLINLSEKFR